MLFNDLRDYLKKVEELGQCKVIEGADWNLEIGLITELQLAMPDPPLLIFDKIKGYKAGYRVVTSLFFTPQRTALALDLPLEAKGMALVQAWRDRLKREFKPVPPVEVKTGPVKENILTGDEIDLFKFPAPKWHELDGGRYIGTGCMVIMRDPDEGWVNLGTYRVQVHDKVTATIDISPQQHGNIIRRKYWAKGLACPVAVTLGQEPMLWGAANSKVVWGVSEYDYTGWLTNRPVEVIKGEVTGLPIPATAEMVLEGEIVPPTAETREEGPFGEFTGYYASGAKVNPAFKVKRIMHRNNPIIQGNPPLLGAYGLGKDIRVAAGIWDSLDSQIPGVKGVWSTEETTGLGMVIVSIKQMYEGHAKQAALLTAGSRQTTTMDRFIVVVDDDIDPSDIHSVIWALTTRCDPATSIDFVKGCVGGPLDPLLPPEKRSRNEFSNTKVLLIACKPYYWKDKFPPTIKSRPELLEQAKAKWGKLLS